MDRDLRRLATRIEQAHGLRAVLQRLDHCRTALQALAEKRPDETTRELLVQRAVQDKVRWVKKRECV